MLHEAIDAQATANEDTMNQVRDEIADLPAEHVEKVLHHVRSLKSIPTEWYRGNSGEAGTPSAAPSVVLVWKCMKCQATQPRTEEAPSSCPSCGAGREELTLREEE